MTPSKSGLYHLRLPQELVDAIIHELDDDSPPLLACSKAAKTFRVPCQRRIFRSILLYSEDSGFSNTFLRAAELLATSPHLAVYVRDLRTPLPTAENEIQSLERVLGALDNVERFMIANTGESINWSPTPPRLVSAIWRIITLPSLDHLHFANIFNLPYSLVYRAASATRVLSLDGVRIRGPAGKTPPAPPVLQLEHLILMSRSLRAVSESLIDLMQHGYLQRLHRLSLTLASGTIQDYLQMYTPLSGVVRHLEIDYSTCTTPITFPRFALLQVLDLSFYLGMARHLPATFVHILSNLPTTAPLVERLSFTFGIMPQIPEIPWTRATPFCLFDDGFMQRRALPRLRSVTFCLYLMMDYFFGCQNVSYDGFIGAVEEMLPGLRDIDMLAFSKRNPGYQYQDHLP
ncbi:hypothetical protein B0H15DRAFT_298947 [Mycena belliarum]|uniref:Uncharacterized protein n=1 Tax=Mycena belliarum TaxID=1033014 RepID=A0AAD6U5F7_9AGAR|nr:hypothetical protein B0H15DRAFT_298947 [Mycena belliae]